MSLRQIAKELGVSPTLLSLWRKGERSIKPELEERYWHLVNGVNGFVNSKHIERAGTAIGSWPQRNSNPCLRLERPLS